MKMTIGEPEYIAPENVSQDIKDIFNSFSQPEGTATYKNGVMFSDQEAVESIADLSEIIGYFFAKITNGSDELIPYREALLKIRSILRNEND